ncbi:unnamed protein product [Thlaspi arvense]|uniref:RNase H type-1 domain-containing protein n=1 Tax=Thlaspi arvense TaxID=13288 RepID=A0AAU9T6T9_THLAR|nr:unnamed protein product [Thlaspi arvense]
MAYLYTARNNLIFERKSFPAQAIPAKALLEAKIWHSANLLLAITQPRHRSSEKKLSIPPVSTCFTDEAWREDTKIGGMGWILKDPGGSTIRENTSARNFVASPLVAEALAILAGLREAI